MAVIADSNVTSLDLTELAKDVHNGLHAIVVKEGGGLHRVWLMCVDVAENAVDHPSHLALAFCLLLAVYHAAALAIQLAEGGPGAGLPIYNLYQPVG